MNSDSLWVRYPQATVTKTTNGWIVYDDVFLLLDRDGKCWHRCCSDPLPRKVVFDTKEDAEDALSLHTLLRSV